MFFFFSLNKGPIFDLPGDNNRTCHKSHMYTVHFVYIYRHVRYMVTLSHFDFKEGKWNNNGTVGICQTIVQSETYTNLIWANIHFFPWQFLI